MEENKTELSNAPTEFDIESSKAELLKQKELERRNRVFNEYLNSEEYLTKLRLRANIFDACIETRKDFLLSRARIYQLCARPDNPAEGAKFFIENFGWTYSPKTERKHLPFILFDFQKDAIRKLVESMDKGEDLFIEKSREMGATWLFFVYIPIWYWLFREGTNILVGSYKEALVDDKTLDSIFGKIDYAIESLPRWLMPKRFSFKAHRNKLKLMNPENGNLVSGDTMNPQFGRGSRKTAVLFDELGFWDYAKDAWEGCADSTNCRIANSTPNGYNFYAMLKETGIKVLSLIWSQHPLKDQEWYEYEKSRRTEESFAQEIEISYVKSLEGKVYPEWDDNHIEKGNFDYDPNIPLFVGWDFGFTDDTGIIWAQRIGGRLRIVDTYRNNGKTIDYYIPFITGIIPSDSYRYSEKDIRKIMRHKNWRLGTHFGDPAGRFTNQVINTSVFDELRKSGINVNFRDEWKEFNKRKTASKLLIMDGIQLNLNEDTKYFNICMSNAAYPKVKNQGMEEVRSMKPKHDYSSHYRSAFEYLALGLSEFRRSERKVFDKFPKKGLNYKRVIAY